MPFKSEKQRKWMWANDPEMAKKWEKEEKMKRETKVKQLIKKMVREMMKEDFAGSYPAHMRKGLDKKRRKQSEVLGYKLTGKDDIRSEIGDATSHTKSGDKYVEEGKLTETKFYAFFNRKKYTIDGKSLYDAKQKAILKLKVPKSKVGLLSIVNAKEHDRGGFRFQKLISQISFSSVLSLCPFLTH